MINLTKDENMLKYGRKIRILLAEIDMNYNDFAQEMDVHRSTVGESWIKRALKPAKHNAFKIHQFFEGQIQPEDMGYSREDLI